MSVRNIADSGVVKIPLGVPPQPWLRNPSWVAMPSVANTDQKFAALFAVYPSGNLVAFTAAGDYTVDWGDGTTQNFTSGTTAEREISYSAAALANTDAPVTLTDAGDLIGRTAHGYTNGMAVQFYNIVTTTGLTAGQTYYVINATANDFQVSATVGGSAVALTNNGSATLLQYKQTLITVTPQAGQNLTSLDLQVRHSAAGTTAYTVNYLDAVLSAPNMTALFIGSASATASTINVRPVIMERFRILSMGSVGTGLGFLFNECRNLRVAELQGINGATDLNSTFNNCTALTDVALRDTSAVTNTSNMFNNCGAITAVPLFNTAAVTNMTSMFSGCRALTSVPLLNTAAVTNMSIMFSGCAALTVVPLFNTAAVTNMTSMFNLCTALTVVPLFNTAAVTNMTSMFNNCRALTSVPLFNTAAVANLNSMFSGCSALTSVPPFNTSAATNTSNMFAGCSALTSVPPFNTSAVTNMANMFFNCSALTSVPLLNTAAVTNFASMFFSCSSLTTVPALNGNAATASSGYNSVFSNCSALARSEVTNFKFSHSYASCKLSAAELDAIYTRLPIAVGQTITVTGNYGTAGDNPAIAIAKGWTVTG
jgi:surface protein